MSDDVSHCESCAGCGVAARAQDDSVIVIERGMSRRVFVERSALAAAAMLLAACSSSDATAPTLSGQTQIDVSSYPQLANVGGVALVSIEGSPVALVRTGATSFVALSRICPHRGGLIVQSSGGFVCTQHGATFTSTGTWTGGQRTSNMFAYPTSYNSTTNTVTVG